MAETLIEGETVKRVAQRHDLFPSRVTDRRRMARQGKLVFPNSMGMGFVPVEVDQAAVPVVAPVVVGRLDTLDIIREAHVMPGGETAGTR
ncbi:IS66 family insertion sequence element accessory protein TnpB [Sulfitobacter porphyrae]|uniref:IS66 family insertion sequence element accessory protein TnpB n=1 Tax=Sulfitobacter porphyrae TaxID=1246864 RepID=A0ABW2BA68_9RHOB